MVLAPDSAFLASARILRDKSSLRKQSQRQKPDPKDEHSRSNSSLREILLLEGDCTCCSTESLLRTPRTT